MPLKKKTDYIPIKCEGWNGKFVIKEGSKMNVSKAARYNQNITDASNFYGFDSEPTVLPPVWDGTFVKSGETHVIPDRNRSDDSQYYQFNTEPTVLPTTWNGQFEVDPNDVRIKPERNHSDERDFAEVARFSEVKQT